VICFACPSRLRTTLLLAALLAIGCAAFSGYLESSPYFPLSPASPRAGAAAATAHRAEQAAARPAGVAEATEVVGGVAPASRHWAGTTVPSRDAEVRPMVAGRVLRRAYAEGSLVHQGDLLFQIDPRPFQARLDQVSAELEQGGGETSRAAVDQARLDLEATAVRSPMTGIAAAQAKEGDLVNPTMVLATVSSIDPIGVRFQLGERDYLRYLDSLERGRARGAGFGALELELADGTTYPLSGSLAALGRRVDLATRTIAAGGLFPNPGNRLRPGQLARVRERIMGRDAMAAARGAAGAAGIMHPLRPAGRPRSTHQRNQDS